VAVIVSTIVVQVKVKCTLVQALKLCTGRTAHRGSRGIALLFHNHGSRRGWGVSVTPRPLFTSGKYPVPIVREAGWAPGPVWTGAENLASTGIRSPDRPARSQSLSRPTQLLCCTWIVTVLLVLEIFWRKSCLMLHIEVFGKEVYCIFWNIFKRNLELIRNVSDTRK